MRILLSAITTTTGMLLHLFMTRVLNMDPFLAALLILISYIDAFVVNKED